MKEKPWPIFLIKILPSVLIHILNWPNLKWFTVLILQIQLLFMNVYMHMLTTYSSFNIPDNFVWNILD